MMAPRNHLKEFIYSMAEMMRDDAEIHVEDTLLTLHAFRDQLEQLYNKYQGNCPPGAEALQEHMRDAVTLLYGSLEDLEDFIDDPDDGLLDRALVQADKSDTLLQRASLAAQELSESDQLFGC